MPTVDKLQTDYQQQIAPGDDTEFLRILTEADLRLLEVGRWRWTRSRVSLTPVSSIVTLPVSHAAILGARHDEYPMETRDEDYEFSPSGIGEVEVGGAGGVRLIDQGLDGSDQRYYKVTSKTADDYTVYTISLYAPFNLFYTADLPGAPTAVQSASTRCPHSGALKQAMLSIVYEEEGNLNKANGFMRTSIAALSNHGQRERGGSRQTITTRPYGLGVSGIQRHR